MNFIELLGHSKVHKSIIDDFDKWVFHLKDIKGYSENTYKSYCYDVCDFFIFFQYSNAIRYPFRLYYRSICKQNN